ncbi:HOOK-domain-containing protein [Armillaria mellea]|nr:HOOK-domain-containing protein [Armillaria mellea]
MSEPARTGRELDAFFNFFATFSLSRPVATAADLSDGAPLFEILSLVDADYFRQSSRQPALSENWILRFGALKRLYRLITQYFSDVLQKPTSSLDVPNLSAMAKDHDITATLIMCRLTIAIGVQCERNKEFIEKIQGLSEVDQHTLMKAIEQVLRCFRIQIGSFLNYHLLRDDHYYRIQSERSQILSEKETLEKVYQTLLDEHRVLQTSYDDVASEKEDLQARLREAKHDAESRRNDKADGMMRAEIDRLRAELQKSEDNLAVAETELDRLTAFVTDLTKKLEELQIKADETDRLKDQVDEYKHASDKLRKTENVMEKYKKKLQEGADLRLQLKNLERENADLINTNATLEEENRKASTYKPLLDSYKTQVSELEAKVSARAQEINMLAFELEQAKEKVKRQEREREKDQETLDLYQERVRELELSSHRPVAKPERKETSDSSFTEAELLGTVIGEDDVDQGLGGELDDAITGTTMTDLKLQIRKLKRELEGVRKNEADASRVLVLENLLEDANRMKARYESDYLAAHREKLMLQRDLEDIRSGKSMGDGAEAAIALRQTLNETVEQLDALRKEFTELEVKLETQSRELTIAKSDLTLVNKDQLDILATLRDSVNEDKVALEADVQRLQKQNKELSDKNRMQLEQVNALLLEKVTLQSEGIGQREKMLQRERDFGDLRASLSGKDLPDDIKSRLLALHEENVTLKESFKTSQEKLQKARQFIKEQDRLFKEEHASKAGSSSGTFEEAEASFRSQIKILEEDLARQKHLMQDMTRRYRREQDLMMSSLHAMGMKTARSHLAAPQKSRPESTSWLSNQRAQVRILASRA